MNGSFFMLLTGYNIFRCRMETEQTYIIICVVILDKIESHTAKLFIFAENQLLFLFK